MRKAYVEENNLELQEKVKTLPGKLEKTRDCSVQTEVHCIPTEGIIRQ